MYIISLWLNTYLIYFSLFCESAQSKILRKFSCEFRIFSVPVANEPQFCYNAIATSTFFANKKKTGKCGLPDHYLLICIYVPNMHLFIVCIMIICIIIVYYCLGLLYVVSKAIVVRL